MDNQDAQQQVAQSVARRGYRDGWTAPQFLARQVAKLAEELKEVAMCLTIQHDYPWTPKWLTELEIAGKRAKGAFDSKWAWNVMTNDLDAMKAELADMQVVLFAAASAIEEITEEPWDLVAAAVAKAAADEARGRRNTVAPGEPPDDGDIDPPPDSEAWEGQR